MNFNSWPASRHISLAPVADEAAGRAAALALRPHDPNFCFKAIYFNADGIVDLIDSFGDVESVTGKQGQVYPVQNFGVQAAGNTTLIEGQFLLLFD